MSTNQYTRIVLNERPIADITPTTFRTETVPFDLQPGPGEVLVQVNWVSLDPAMRGWLRDTRSYVPPVQIGEVMRAMGLATVVKVSEGSKLQHGDVVSCVPGKWPCQYCPGSTQLIFRLGGVCHRERGSRPETLVRTTKRYIRLK
jgi:NADPH-dependent curcumin reductase CurA